MDGVLFEVYLVSKLIGLRPKEVLKMSILEKEIILQGFMKEMGISKTVVDEEDIKELRKAIFGEENVA